MYSSQLHIICVLYS